MDSTIVRQWLVTMLGPALELSDSISEKGFIGQPRWIEIGWKAEGKFLWGHQIPEDRFRELEHFGDLVPLVMELRSKLEPSKTVELITH